MEKHTTLSQETPDLLEERASMPNKYPYAEFAGWNGERYLKTLLRQILPMALYRTWEIFVEHQAVGQDCYVGVAHLAEIAGRASRTIEKNLATLIARHLLVERVERKVFRRPDGAVQSKVVIVKDFAGLYALAHDYHEWMQSADYVAPDRRMLALVEREPGLRAKVSRFANYRKWLSASQPWPDPPEPAIPAKDEQTGEYPAKAPSDVRSTARAKASGKRITEDHQVERPEGDSSDSASFPSGEKAEGRGETRVGSSEGEDQRAAIQGSRTCVRVTPQEREAIAPTSVMAPTQPKPVPPSAGKREGQTTHMEHGRSSQTRKTMPSAPSTCQSLHTSESADSSPVSQLASSFVRQIASSFVRQIAASFGDRNPKGTRTRLLTLLNDAPLDQPAEVAGCLLQAYVIARDTRQIRPEHTDAQTGQPNRMPLFCALVQRFVQARVQGHGWDAPAWHDLQQAIASDEHLTRWWADHRHLIGELGEPIVEEPEAWPNPPQAWREDAEQDTEPPTGSAPAPSAHRAHLSQTEQQREERAAAARKVRRLLLKMAVPIQEPMVLWEHFFCGCPLYYQRGGKEVCALCSPDPAWSEDVLSLLRGLVDEPGKTETWRERPAEPFVIGPEASDEREACASSGRGSLSMSHDEAVGEAELSLRHGKTSASMRSRPSAFWTASQKTSAARDANAETDGVELVL